MNTFPVLLAALCVYAIAYRYYSAFIAAKALSLDDRRITPGHAFADGHNYVASPRWVLFGHHFAAIAGAGPLVGPTLAAQFGIVPGVPWLLAVGLRAGLPLAAGRCRPSRVCTGLHRAGGFDTSPRPFVSGYCPHRNQSLCRTGGDDRRALYSSGHARRPRHRSGQRAFE